MKSRYIIIIACCLFFINIDKVYSQRGRQKEINFGEYFANDTDKDFEVMDVPEKWKNESAVVLAQKISYNYSNSNKEIYFKELSRRRLKILDNAALKDFSEFFFYADKNKNIGINIIKPDGTTKSITIDDAVKVTTSIPDFFKSNYNSSKIEYYKVAMPGLEIGDIIDYYYEVSETRFISRGGATCFTPVFYLMSGSYSVVNQKVEFITSRGFYVNFKSVNGAPELAVNENLDHRTYSYSFIDNDRDKATNTLWTYKYLSIPSIKFQVCFNQIGKEDKAQYFLGSPNVPKTSVTPEEISNKINLRYKTISHSAYAITQEVSSFLHIYHKKTKDIDELVKAAYYYFRHIVLIEAPYSINPSGSPLPEKIGDEYFSVILKNVLVQRGIKAEIIVAPIRSFSKLEDVVLLDELTWFLKVEDQFVYNFSKHSVFEDPNYLLEGVDALLIDARRGSLNHPPKTIKIPVSEAQQNSGNFFTKVKLDDNFETLNINQSSNLKGLYKLAYRNAALLALDVKEIDYLTYGGDKPKEVKKTRNKVKLAEEQRVKEEEKEEILRKQKEWMKEDLKSSFPEIVSYDEFELLETGRDSKNKDLVYKEIFKVNDLVKKVGKNYIFDIGLLIGNQVEIHEKDKDRKFDVHMPYARSINHKIEFEVPKGFIIDGWKNLNVNIDNSIGTFESKATLQENILTVETKKVYKSNFLPQKQWPEMVSFLDKAYDFSQKKVVLKKI